MRRLLLTFAMLSCFACAHAQSDLRITMQNDWHTSAPRQESTHSTTTIYRKGDRIRVENDWPQMGHMVSIQQCDAQKFYSMWPHKHEYAERPMNAVLPPKPDAETARSNEGEPNLIIEISTVDTGETKQAFGHTARHYIVTTTHKPSPELGRDTSESVEDVWYLDMPDLSSCTRH